VAFIKNQTGERASVLQELQPKIASIHRRRLARARQNKVPKVEYKSSAKTSKELKVGENGKKEGNSCAVTHV